jgi:dihydroorotase
MFLALRYSKYSGLPVINHCEDKEIAGNGVMNEGWVSSRLGLRGIPAAAEEIMIARDIFLANLTGARLHIAHVSTKGSVKLIRQAKSDGTNITAEVTPNHLLLTEERIVSAPLQNGQELAYDTTAKVNPPLRTEADIEALIEGIKDGTIDAIATDHAPHTHVDKMCEFGTAAFGISSFETAFAGLLSLVHRNILDYKTLIAAMTGGPAAIINSSAGISGGLSEGKPADITVFDPSLTWTVDSNNFISRGKNTPYNGMEMKGKVLLTIAGGKPAFRDKSIE